MLEQHDRNPEEQEGPSVAVDIDNGWAYGHSDTTTRTYIAAPTPAAVLFRSPITNRHIYGETLHHGDPEIMILARPAQRD